MASYDHSKLYPADHHEAGPFYSRPSRYHNQKSSHTSEKGPSQAIELQAYEESAISYLVRTANCPSNM